MDLELHKNSLRALDKLQATGLWIKRSILNFVHQLSFRMETKLCEKRNLLKKKVY